MIYRLLAIVAAALPLAAPAALSEMPSRALEGHGRAPVAFRAPHVPVLEAAAFAAPQEKAAAVEEPGGLLKVANVRSLAKAARVDAWTAVPGGFAARLRASSEEAQGLRVKLELGSLPGVIEARVQGADGRVEAMVIDASSGPEAWSPWTAGASQVIELFSAVLPSPDAVRVGAVLHFTDSPLLAKAAGVCTVPTMCTTNDAVLDAAIAQRKRSVMKLTFVEKGSGYVCSGTLINTERFPAAYVLTANHCINNAAAAASVATIWFYENTDCDSGFVNPSYVQVAGGVQLIFGSYAADSTLLLMNRTPPVGAVYAGWSATRVAPGTPIVSISHPDGDTSRLALGTMSHLIRIIDRPLEQYGINFSRGIIQGGSSGSGLFVLADGGLQLRGVLTGTTLREAGGMSCTNLGEEGIYSRFEFFEPEIDQYIRNSPQAADDAPNRVQELFNAPAADPNGVDMPLNVRPAPLVLNRRIDYGGDVDVYRFTLTQQATVTLGSEGTIDTLGSLLDSNGVHIETNDDKDDTTTNFSITRTLAAGTYFVQVTHWEALGTGAYTLRMSASAGFDTSSANYTDLWWNANESGWGLNLNHQGNVVFATLFTYDSSGPMWLVMSNGEKQADGSYLGTLYRTTGPAFNAVPWTSALPIALGTMRISFSGRTAGTLTYTAYGTTVTKNITRQTFSASATTCTWTTADRASAVNYQDLWWNPSESGWGVNVTHQGNVLFATLFTYDASGRGLWLVMSNGNRTGNGTYSGTLYRTSGPAFSANPWSAVTPTAVGTMSFAFSNGNSGTLTYTLDGTTVTKAIQRQAFSSPVTVCQ